MTEKDKASLCINGRQIYLREIRLSDANENYCGWLNDPSVNQYLESRFDHWSPNKLKDYIRGIKNDKDYLFLAIIAKKSKKHIGNIKLGPINRYHKFADLGIIIGEKSFWGKGIATEAIRLISGYAFNTLKLHKLTAGAYAKNIGSIKVFKKAGFYVEGIRGKHYLYKGKYIDAVLLGISKK